MDRVKTEQRREIIEAKEGYAGHVERLPSQPTPHRLNMGGRCWDSAMYEALGWQGELAVNGGASVHE